MSSGQTTEPNVETAGDAARERVASPPLPTSPALLELRGFLLDLLDAQCLVVGATGGAIFLAAGPGRTPTLMAQSSRGLSRAETLTPALLSRLERIAVELWRAGEGGALPPGRAETLALPRGGSMYGEESRLLVLAAPLLADGRLEGASVLIAPSGLEADAELSLRALAMSSGRFEAFLWRRQCLAESEQKHMLRETIELLDASQQGPSAGAMGAIMCQELKRRFGCTRVSIGLVRREFVRVAAVTGADEIDRNAPAIEAIEAAMEECAAQDAEVPFPPPPGAEDDPGSRRVTRAHAELSRRFGPSAAVSLPLRVEGDLVGVVSLERDAADPFPAAALPLLRLVAETIGPSLWTRRLADRGVLAVTRDRLLDLGTALVGPRHTGAKLIAGTLLSAFVLAAAVPIPARVGATAEVRATVTRTIVPPFTGYLDSVSVRPGDAVAKGDVLARMATGDLDLQVAESEARRAAYAAQRDDALAKGELANVRVLASQVEEVDAALTLLRDHLARSEIRSPIDGIVGRGELDQFLRARVEPTQPLFEVVTAQREAVAYVDERDVQRVRPGQEGRLVIKARPGERTPVRVSRVNPVAEVVRGRNVYRCDVEFAGDAPPPDWLRPGMTGTVRLRDGWTTALASGLRPILDEARLRMWW